MIWSLDSRGVAFRSADPLSDTFTVLTADGTAQVVTISITGTNDAAIVSGNITGSVVEAGGSAAVPGSGEPTSDLPPPDPHVCHPPHTFQEVTTAAASTHGYGTYTVYASGHCFFF